MSQKAVVLPWPIFLHQCCVVSATVELSLEISLPSLTAVEPPLIVTEPSLAATEPCSEGPVVGWFFREQQHQRTLETNTALQALQVRFFLTNTNTQHGLSPQLIWL